MTSRSQRQREQALRDQRIVYARHVTAAVMREYPRVYNLLKDTGRNFQVVQTWKDTQNPGLVKAQIKAILGLQLRPLPRDFVERLAHHLAESFTLHPMTGCQNLAAALCKDFVEQDDHQSADEFTRLLSQL